MMGLWIFVLLKLIPEILTASNLQIANNSINCDILDTVNITGGYIDANGSYHKDGLIYKSGKFGYFTKIPLNSTFSFIVDLHVRGCICEIKNCIRICRYCENDQDDLCIRSDKLLLPSEGDEREISLENGEFAVVVGKVCERYFVLEPEEYEDDIWIVQNVSSLEIRFQSKIYNFLEISRMDQL